MRKYSVMFLVFLLLISSFVETAAQSVTFHQNDQVVIKSDIAYVWIRSSPSSDCACVEYVVTSTKRVMRILDTQPTSDGTENWWHVSTMTRPIKQGWVEEKSLTLLKPASTPTLTTNGTEQPHQFFSSAVQIREGVPFIWIRSSPSSAASILQTVKFSRPTNQSQCLTLATVDPVVRWDGHQWWRALISSTGARTDIQAGWVEENSLTDCIPGTATATASSNIVFPSATPPQSETTQVPPTTTNAAYQPFERGLMIWRQDNQTIYVLFNTGNFSPYLFESYTGLANPNDIPPTGRYTPINGFGKVWNGETNFGALVRDKIGWATGLEQGYTATVSGYTVASVAKPDSHILITIPDGRTLDMGSAFSTWLLN